MVKRTTAMLFLMLFTSLSWAEILYVHDERRLGVRPQANSTDAPLAIVSTGARLEVLEHSGSFTKVRTTDGVEGWVNSVYLGDQKPSLVLLEELEAKHQAVLLSVAEQEQRLQASEAENSRLAGILEGLVHEKALLQQQNAQYRAELGVDKHDMDWLYRGLTGIALFLFGILLGVKWNRHRISERMGGLEL